MAFLRKFYFDAGDTNSFFKSGEKKPSDDISSVESFTTRSNATEYKGQHRLTPLESGSGAPECYDSFNKMISDSEIEMNQHRPETSGHRADLSGSAHRQRSSNSVSIGSNRSMMDRFFPGADYFVERVDSARSSRSGHSESRTASWASSDAGQSTRFLSGESSGRSNDMLNEPATPLWKTISFEFNDVNPDDTTMKLPDMPCKSMSTLECLVECLKGTPVKKKTFGTKVTLLIWIDKYLSSLGLREMGDCRWISTADILQVKALGYELKIKTLEEKLLLTFQSRVSCEIFLTGLALLVPITCIVRHNSKDIQDRLNYNPVRDTFNNKPVRHKKRFGDYILLKGVGRGACGKVYLALHLLERRFYAIKAIKRLTPNAFLRNAFSESINEGMSRTNERETQIMRMLANQPNVVSLKEILEDREHKRVLIACEYMPNGSLMRTDNPHSKARPLPEALARKVFVEALTGVNFLHRQNIVHRDIKPDNLLTQPDGMVKLSDFGTSKVYEMCDKDTLMHKETMVGTPSFMAPEHCASIYAPKATAPSYAADVWSLGATLYYMVFGALPFYRLNLVAAYDAICCDPLTFPISPKVSTELKHLLREMLQKDPRNRATVAQLWEFPWVKGKPSASSSSYLK